jgi:hypothetical protein
MLEKYENIYGDRLEYLKQLWLLTLYPKLNGFRTKIEIEI